jgi:acetyltransferase-like isoleucine patch superfamily enzyme
MFRRPARPLTEVAAGAELVLGEGCVLGPGARVLVRAGRVELGPGVVLGERATIVAHAGVHIGAGAVLEDGALVVDFDPGFADPETPVRLQALRLGPVHIGDGARIGLRACVLRGARIGAGAVVGPHAVVTGDVPEGGRVGGVPARALSRA